MITIAFHESEVETAIRAMELYGQSDQFYLDGTPDTLGSRLERKLREALQQEVTNDPTRSLETPRDS
jgi:hypothetical protein